MVRAQAVRFVLVGAFTALADYGSYRLLLALDVAISPAKAGGFVVGTTLSYLLNRAWTFGAAGREHAVGRFIVVYAATLVVNVAVNAVAVTALAGVPGRITVAWLAAQAVASLLNFLGMRHFVFPATGRVPHG